MPTYSYLCDKCEKKFDAFHSMHCTDPQVCPTCGHPGRKLLSASSIIFKGSGFYTTDYRDSGYVEAQKRDGSDSGGSAKSAGGDGGENAPASGSGSGNGGGKAASAPASVKTSSKSQAAFSPPSSSASRSASSGEIMARAA